jgi:hypothetical protein
VGLMAAALSSIQSHPASAAGSAPVTVVNTPLPVQGTVGVNNFPSNQAVSGTVAISNFPSNQTVSGTVNVGNFPSTLPVSFTNASTSPLYIRDVDGAAHNRYTYNNSCNVPTDGSVNGCNVQFTVPSGFELVVETVTVEAGLNPGEKGIGRMIVNATLSQAFGADFILSPVLNNGAFASTQLLRAYADPGAIVLFEGTVKELPTSGGPVSFSFSLSGYLVACGTGAGCPVP